MRQPTAAAAASAVLCLINAQRAHFGLPLLSEQPLLERAAQQWSNWMTATQRFTDTPNFSAEIARTGYAPLALGQDIASGYRTARAVVSGWMGDGYHCRNILTPTYRDVGIGVSPRAVRPARTAATWTVDFGLAVTEPPRSQNNKPEAGCPY